MRLFELSADGLLVNGERWRCRSPAWDRKSFGAAELPGFRSAAADDVRRSSRELLRISCRPPLRAGAAWQRPPCGRSRARCSRRPTTDRRARGVSFRPLPRVPGQADWNASHTISSCVREDSSCAGSARPRWARRHRSSVSSCVPVHVSTRPGPPNGLGDTRYAASNASQRTRIAKLSKEEPSAPVGAGSVADKSRRNIGRTDDVV